MIEAISSALPEGRLTNDDLAAVYPDWTADKIFEKTGIRERRVVAPDECASDLAFRAAESLLGSGDRAGIDFLLFCTQSPDLLIPTTACTLQQRLGLATTCAALDFNLGCSGFVYGLAVAQGLFAGHLAKRVLLLNADTYTRFIDPMDRSTRTLFGDAGAATLLSAESRRRVHSFVLGTDGAGAEQLVLPDSGCRVNGPRPSRPESIGADRLYMNGPEVFNFTIKTVPRLVNSVLNKAGLKLADIDLFVFHQANAYMLEHLRRRLTIPPEKFELCLENVGNTVSATIPLALEQAIQRGRLKGAMRVLLAGFGVGFSWGGCIVDWND